MNRDRWSDEPLIIKVWKYTDGLLELHRLYDGVESCRDVLAKQWGWMI